MIITIAGCPGSGKTSVGKALAKRLGYEFFSAGDYARELARKRKISIVKQAIISGKDSGIDKKIDKKLSSYSRKKNAVIEGHLAALMIPKAEMKIYFWANLLVRAKRIAKRDGVYFFEAFFNLLRRDKSDVDRWKKEYGFNYKNKKAYTHVINTSGMEVDGVVEKILGMIKKKK